MTAPTLPANVVRFLLTSIPSVPHLEAMLLLRQEADQPWSPKALARRLYLQERMTDTLLSELAEAGILVRENPNVPMYRFLPASDELRLVIEELADLYAKNIVEVSNLIHSRVSKAQQFADAFKLRRES